MTSVVRGFLRIVSVAVLFSGAVACEGTVGVNPGDADIAIEGAAPVGEAGGSIAGPAGIPAGGGTGEALYTQYCAGCHGANAAGTPTFSGSIAGWSPIHDVVKNGQGAMPALALADADIDAIQEYLLSLGGPDWSELTGQEVFAAECARCHGAQGEGTERAPQLHFRDDELFDYAVRRGGLADRFESPMPAYDTTTLTDAQVADIVGWLNEAPNATTGEGLYKQFCANCHGDDTLPARVFESVDEEPIFEVVREGKEDHPTDVEYMSFWTASEISDAEISLLQGYIDANL